MEIQRARPVARYLHGTEHFTEGLLPWGGLVLETTGNYEQSRIIYRARPYMAEIARHRFDDDFFAECLCPGPDGRVIILGYREHQALLWNVQEARVEGTLAYDRAEGWGICTIDGHHYTTDGSSTLVRRRQDLGPDGSVEVVAGGEPLAGLNALTAFRGHVLACVYGRDLLAEIDPATGVVLTLVDATELRQWEHDGAQVLNGVCPYGAGLLVTGKYWTWIHEIALEPTTWDDSRLGEVLAGLPRLYLPAEKRLLTRATYARERAAGTPPRGTRPYPGDRPQG